MKMSGRIMVCVGLLGACGDGSKHASGGDGGSSDAGPVTRDGAVGDASDGWDGSVPAPGDVRINEVDCAGDRVELVNAGAAAQDLSGYALTDDLANATRRFALDGSVAPGEHKVVALSGIGLKCGRDNAFLVQGDALSDVAASQAVPSGATLGRLPDVTGAFAANTPTLGAPNSAWMDPSPALFAPFETPVAITLVLDDANTNALRTAPRSYATATLTVKAGSRSVGPISVGVRLKGSLGSFRPFDDKPALKIEADRFVAGQTVFGQSKLTLNNFAQDPSTVHEWLGYQTYAAHGIPTPRTGYASVTVNGASYGTYLLLEDATTSAYLSASFDSTLGLYEPAEGADVTPEQVSGFDVKRGPKDDFSALLAIATPLADGKRDSWFAEVGTKVDWNEVLHAQAVDVINGNPDGYALMRNNYVLHVNEAGVLRMMPWGIDSSYSSPMEYFRAKGLLLSRCFEDPACSALWVKALSDAHDKGVALLASDVPQKVRMLGALNAQRFASDTRFNADASQIPAAVEAALARFQTNLDAVAERIACQRDPNGDFDRDGRRCELDCDDNDPTRYRGAAEVCGDMIDQDCDGVADDGPDCPACVPAPNDTSLFVCPRAQTIGALRSACTALGAHPLVVADEAENSRVIAAASPWLGSAQFFVDLSDETSTDSYVWADGDPSTYRNFNGGYPFSRNAGQGPQCTVISTDSGAWQTEPCDARFRGMCER